MNLREATAELHSKAEKMEFNQKMFRGELSKKEYLHYLIQQSVVFQCIEEHNLPQIDPALKRLKNVFEDIQELQKDVTDTLPELESTKKYGIYLESLKGDEVLAHVYLNYLALVFGGQIMKSKVPGSGKMYQFENVQEVIKNVRGFQTDDMTEEVNKGFKFIIDILDELQKNAG
jgi:heme oxygenase